VVCGLVFLTISWFSMGFFSEGVFWSEVPIVCVCVCVCVFVLVWFGVFGVSTGYFNKCEIM
jgi:hypothetical protein